jgi:hypothetical protein
MSNSPLVQECSAASVGRTVIDYTDEVKNSRIEAVSSGRLKTLIQTLVDISNFRLLQGFPIDVIYIPIDDIGFEIGSSYHPELKFSKMKSFVIDALEEAERLSDVTRCLDALRVLVNYTNIVVFSRFNHGLELRDRNIRAIYE